MNFCTLFDSKYLIKGVAMLNSLLKHCPEARVYVLCMDNLVFDAISSIFPDSCLPIKLVNIENRDVLEAKSNRTFGEYCWTLSSVLPSYILDEFLDVNCITYIDADLLFFSSPKCIFDEIGNNSIGITEHRFPPEYLSSLANGRFCVQWVTIRRTEQGLACLNLWRKQCLEWCYARNENGLYGDQKYLDSWPDLYSECHIIQNVGAGLAPWNYCQYDLIESNGGVFVEKSHLIFYHYHGFKIYGDHQFLWIDPHYASVKAPFKYVYTEYERALRSARHDINNAVIINDWSKCHDSNPIIYNETYSSKFRSFMKRITMSINELSH